IGRQRRRARLRHLIDVGRGKETHAHVIKPELRQPLPARAILWPFGPLGNVQRPRVRSKPLVFEQTGQVAPDLVERRQCRARREGARRVVFGKKPSYHAANLPERWRMSFKPSQNTFTPSSIFTPALRNGSSRNFGDS